MAEKLFVPAPFFFLRSPRWSLEDWHQILKKEDWQRGVLDLYEQDELLREAIAIASPSLWSALEKKAEEKGENICTSLLNYALRMATRAIPFGLFSFVGTGSWGEKTAVSFDLSKVQKRARPDMSWIYALIQQMTQDDLSFFSSLVRTNPLVSSTEERLFLSYIRLDEKERQKSSETFSIRATRLVKEALRLAENPITAGKLCQDLVSLMPGLEEEKVKRVIQQLFSQQFLLPSLLPSLLSFSPFEDLLPHLPHLEGIYQKIGNYNRCPLGKGSALLDDLQKEMGAKASAKTFLQVDTIYKGGTLTLPHSVYNELTDAVTMLWQISPRRGLSPSLQAYHAKFMEKYGSHRRIPLLELLSPEKGIGSFEKNGSPPPIKQKSSFSRIWEKWLYRKWQECLQKKDRELVITQKIIDDLFSLAKETPPAPHEALLSMDLFCKIIAHSSEQVDRGDFQLLITQLTWQGGSSIGRFVDLLDDPVQEQFRRFLQGEEALEKEALFVEVSYWPITGHNANVATHPCFRKYRLDLEEKKKGDETLSLEDIYVGAAVDRFYLTLKTGNCEVIPRIGNLLNPTFAPLPIRFMREAVLAKHQLVHPFSWGVHEDGIFLPRIAFGRTILSPAQWNLDFSSFHKESLKTMPAKFSAWADEWGLPQSCFLVRGDQHLLIDRSHPAHLGEISHKLKKGESLRFAEKIENPWIQSERGSHLCEIVVPFMKNPAHVSQPTSLLSSPSLVSLDERLKPLGSEWLYIKLYMNEEGMARFLVQQLAPLSEQLVERGEIAGSFFIRYRDPEPHLRFRIRLIHPDLIAPLIFTLNEKSMDWLKMGVIKEMVYGNYEREVERYGGSYSIEAAELLFCSDSAAVLHLLNAVLNKTLSLPEPIVHALSVINFLQGFGLSATDMVSLLSSERRTELKGFREHKGELLKLGKKLLAKEEANEIIPFLQTLEMNREAQAYFQSQTENLPPPLLFGIYSSLLHMHCNRLGCDSSAEEKGRLYASHLLYQLEQQNRHVVGAR